MTDPIVAIETDKGTIKIQVHQTEAPITANNFLDLVEKGFYNGLNFHRYVPDFCIQGGCPTGSGTGGYTDPATGKKRNIKLEVKPHLKHDSAGVVAMARSNDPDSASSQFYITLGPANFLDMDYAVFGKVIEGDGVFMQLRQGDKMNKVSVVQTAVK
jgi:cyclophilin family peptidyl-prolyl cis-trans isomerase